LAMIEPAEIKNVNIPWSRNKILKPA
jgi:hypothetical protein